MAAPPSGAQHELPLADEPEAGDAKTVWHRLGRMFGRDDDVKPPSKDDARRASDSARGVFNRRLSRKVVPGLPRPGTFKRQNSERRERLEPVVPAAEEKRPQSVDRRKLLKGRPRSLPPVPAPRLSAPAVCSHNENKEFDAGGAERAGPRRRSKGTAGGAEQGDARDEREGEGERKLKGSENGRETEAAGSAVAPVAPDAHVEDISYANPLAAPVAQLPLPPQPFTLTDTLQPYNPPPLQVPFDPRPQLPPSPPPDMPDRPESPIDTDELRAEQEDRWILNLSMHFRDRSPREKFFVTFAETRSLWRRITVSVDYRNSPPDSLERDLQELSYQRDKSFRIYEAIRTSLPDIQWYETVTNLRLETSADDRLHVHVTEDVNEIISYPSIRLLDHIDVARIPERDVEFDSHMSGFVYKVRARDRVLIKKEIPGPDSVEEFLYEINALYALMDADNVVRFEGLVVDDEVTVVKGILIAFAEKGPLVDLIYDEKGYLSWERRQKWAWQIINGLSKIHESGYVQGDFTLSNIVIDENDTAIIIDINRRGCPVGWEPPEIARMIQSGQRISMYIGVKSDLFQLGMVLWALAEEQDEPERQQRPLSLDRATNIPRYYRDLVDICLQEDPRNRASAAELLERFPEMDRKAMSPAPLRHLIQSSDRTHQSLDTPYIDPREAVGHEDLRPSSRSPPTKSRISSRSRGFSDSRTYIEGRPSSVDIPFDGPSSYIIPRRGRSPPINTAHLRSKSYERGRPTSIGAGPEPQVVAVSPSNEHRWETIYDGEGNSYLVEADEDPEEHERRIQRSIERNRPQNFGEAGIKEQLPHVDSGLADMEGFSRSSTGLSFGRASTGFSVGRASTGLSLNSSRFSSVRGMDSPGNKRVAHVDSGLADMDLAGIGENEALKDYSKDSLELDITNIGEPGPELVTVSENEVVEDFSTERASLEKDRVRESLDPKMEALKSISPHRGVDEERNVPTQATAHDNTSR